MRFILEKKGRRYEYAVPEGNMIVGRDRKSDISIQDSNVSRHHMTVMRRVDDVTIRDLGSRNGTFVNNERITEAKLQPGDIVRMGNLSLFFTDGTPGVEIPKGLGDMNDAAENQSTDEGKTPADGIPVPEAPGAPLPQSEPQPPAAEGALPAEPPFSGEEDGSLMEKARAFYMDNKPLCLGAGVGVVLLLIIVSAAVNLSGGKDGGKKTRRMSIAQYDKFLDTGIDHFDKWIENRSGKKNFRKAKEHFDIIIKHHERQTGNIMQQLVEVWGKSDPAYDRFDWERAQRLIDELISNDNSTPRARTFGKARKEWWRREKMTRTIVAAGDKAYDADELEKALVEYKKLEAYPDSRGYKTRKERIPTLRLRIFELYRDRGLARMDSSDWERAKEPFRTALNFATEEQRLVVEKHIRTCDSNLQEGTLFDEVLDLESQDELDKALAKLLSISITPENSRRIERIRKRFEKKIMLRDGKALYENGQAEAAIKMLSNPAVISDVEAADIRDKAGRILQALKKGDDHLAAAMEKIRAMEKPDKISGFDAARNAWSEVKDIITDHRNVYFKRMDQRLGDLTNEKIGSLYYDKAKSLIDQSELKLARDFINLAREYDLSLGSKVLKQWRSEAGKKYNVAINMIDSNPKKAKELLQWIIDTLRAGDSEYYEKARNAMSKIKD